MTPPNLSLVLIMACFWVTLWLVNKFLIVPVSGVLAERAQRIDGAEREWAAKNEEYLAATQRLESEIEAAAKEGSRLREELRQQAQQARQERLDKARKTADGKLTEALTVLDQDAQAARADLRSQAANLGALFAEKLLGRKVAS